ncbi:MULTISPECIES: N-acetyltransferase [unclassified Dietzia]|uniref:N-acetyltransferase n=1 Tax=unclassified Dietzia TaxID=2617939 RepID=UPI0015FB819C|nr:MULTISPECIES: N-acetyltransferase [unclassified Dietzia]MBB1053457.1 N-acetyltransferase [Dietzia sp. B44]MBB1055857.1 N-acetyltransferase [Dietzia sp. B19]
MSSNVIEAAAERRTEVFAAIASANGTEDAVQAVSHLLAVSADEAREVLRAPLESFIGATTEHPVSAGPAGFELHPFRDSEDHRSIYHTRSTDASSATGGEWDESRTEQERRDGLSRIESESAMWFVAMDTARGTAVGLVFGEQINDGDVDVAIWIHPEERKKGYGFLSLKESRRELAAFFPGKHVIVRAPLPSGK